MRTVIALLVFVTVLGYSGLADAESGWKPRKANNRKELDKILNKHKLTFVIAHPPEKSRCPSCSAFEKFFEKLYEDGSRPNQAVWLQQSLYQVLTKLEDFPGVVDDDAHICLFTNDRFVKKYQGPASEKEVGEFVYEALEKYGVELKTGKSRCTKLKMKACKAKKQVCAWDQKRSECRLAKDFKMEQQREQRREAARHERLRESHPEVETLIETIRKTSDPDKLRELHGRLGDEMGNVELRGDFRSDFHDLTKDLFTVEVLEERLSELESELEDVTDNEERRRLKVIMRVVRLQLADATQERKRQGGGEIQRDDMIDDLKYLETLERRLNHQDDIPKEERKTMSAELTSIRTRLHSALNKMHREM